MTTRTQLTTIDTTIAPEFYGDFGGDFDTEAANKEYREKLQTLAQSVVPSIAVHTDGSVTIDVPELALGQTLDWAHISRMVDVTGIVNRHERRQPQIMIYADELQIGDVIDAEYFPMQKATLTVKRIRIHNGTLVALGVFADKTPGYLSRDNLNSPLRITRP